MRIHHIGYLVDSIENALLRFEGLGFVRVGDISEDTQRGIHILFMRNEGYVIELIAPVNEESPSDALRRQYKNTPYHICYETDDLDKTVENLLGSKTGYMMLNHPSPAQCIPGSPRVAFLLNKHMGMIELVEGPCSSLDKRIE